MTRMNKIMNCLLKVKEKMKEERKKEVLTPFFVCLSHARQERGAMKEEGIDSKNAY